MSPILSAFGRALAHYLSGPNTRYAPVATSTPDALMHALRPCDVLLVEGNSRISTAIKYLTQSTWSHAALYVGGAPATRGDAEPAALVEADLVEGVRMVPLSMYADHHTRICRPIGLSDDDRERVVADAMACVGQTYDLKNVFDLARYLLPTPPVPTRFRRRMLALGSGEPTRAICSTLIARLFQSIRYPILPTVEHRPAPRAGCDDCVDEILHIRHHSLFAPRDFDISPYFMIVKPSIGGDFDYRQLTWAEADTHSGVSGSAMVPAGHAAPAKFISPSPGNGQLSRVPGGRTVQ